MLQFVLQLVLQLVLHVAACDAACVAACVLVSLVLHEWVAYIYIYVFSDLLLFTVPGELF